MALSPVSGTLDHVGPLARTVEDAAALTYATAGRDVRDSATSARAAPDYLENLDPNVDGIVVGIADDGSKIQRIPK